MWSNVLLVDYALELFEMYGKVGLFESVEYFDEIKQFIL